MITRQSQLESSERGTEDVTGDCHGPAVPSASSSDAAKVPNRVNFCRDPDAEKLLINYCVKHSAYKKTKGSNMEQKWTLVRIADRAPLSELAGNDVDQSQGEVQSSSQGCPE